MASSLLLFTVTSHRSLSRRFGRVASRRAPLGRVDARVLLSQAGALATQRRELLLFAAYLELRRREERRDVARERGVALAKGLLARGRRVERVPELVARALGLGELVLRLLELQRERRCLEADALACRCCAVCIHMAPALLSDSFSGG